VVPLAGERLVRPALVAEPVPLEELLRLGHVRYEQDDVIDDRVPPE
jgi:hypothetical protein